MVLVLHPFFFVHVEQGVDDVLCTLREHVAEGDGDECSLRFGQVRAEVGADAVRHAVIVAAADGDGAVVLQVVAQAGGGQHGNLAQRGVDHGVETSLDDALLRVLLTIVGKFGQFKAVGALEGQGEGSEVFGGEAVENHLDGLLFAVEGNGMEGAGFFVVHVVVQAFTGFCEEGGGLDGEHLVVNVAFVYIHSHFGEHGSHVAVDHAGVAAVLYHDGGRALVHRLGGENVPKGNAATQEDGEQNPTPL